MAKVTFTIDGPKGAVTLRAMLLAFQNQLAILNDLDTNITGTGEPVLEWVVSDITAKNSVTGTLASQPPPSAQRRSRKKRSGRRR